MDLRFSQTKVETNDVRSSVKLVNTNTQEAILELTRHELEDAIHQGYVDPDHLHYSLFEYHRIRGECVRAIHEDAVADVDELLSGLKPRQAEDD